MLAAYQYGWPVSLQPGVAWMERVDRETTPTVVYRAPVASVCVPSKLWSIRYVASRMLCDSDILNPYCVTTRTGADGVGLGVGCTEGDGVGCPEGDAEGTGGVD